MPPIAAAVGAVGSAIIGAGSAAVGVAGSALGGLTGLAAAGISTASSLFAPGYGETGGPIGPPQAGLGYTAGSVLSKVLPVVGSGRQIYEMFKDDDQPGGGSPTKTTIAGTQAAPINILGTLPDLIRRPIQQILTTPAPAPAPDNLSKYLPIAAVLVLGFLIFKGK